METSPFALDAYLDRIGFQASSALTAAVLESLHLAHATHIPFENLDILLGRPIRLDLESLQDKLVRQRRGGYCFEQNQLFALAAEAMGFRVTRLAARVRFGSMRIAPRTHMVLSIEADGRAWLADVGFGGDGLLLPMPLAEGAVRNQFHWTYRLAKDSGQWVLQMQMPDGWVDLFVFTLEPQLLVDYEVANYYVSTHPESIFVRTPTVQHSTREARYIIRGRDYTIDRGDGAPVTRRIGEGEMPGLLQEFGLRLPAGTRIPMRDEPG
jgi:N-hydroxyarylamine O-acetyltransferase